MAEELLDRLRDVVDGQIVRPIIPLGYKLRNRLLTAMPLPLGF